MIPNNIKLEHAVIFIKCIASVVPLMFPPKTLILNETKLRASNLLNDLEFVEHDLEKTFSKNI